MVAFNKQWLQSREEEIAQLTEIAYRAILANGYRGPFIELELSLWDAVRQAVDQRPAREFPSAEFLVSGTERNHR